MSTLPLKPDICERDWGDCWLKKRRCYPLGCLQRQGVRGKNFAASEISTCSFSTARPIQKSLNGRDRKKAAEGEHAWTVGPAVAWLDGPVCRPRNRHVRRDEKQSRRFPHLGRRLCYAVANFKLFARRFAHLVHETKLTSLVVALDKKSFFNRRGVLQTNLAPASAGIFCLRHSRGAPRNFATHQKLIR